jgi:hypothetical protein
VLLKDGEPAVIILRRGVDTWTPYSAIRPGVVNQRVTQIFDYLNTPWILESATSTILAST